MPIDARFDSPRHDRVACQLGSVIAQNRFGFAACGNQTIELTGVSAAGQRESAIAAKHSRVQSS
jgi:hypothetical protein